MSNHSTPSRETRPPIHTSLLTHLHYIHTGQIRLGSVPFHTVAEGNSQFTRTLTQGHPRLAHPRVSYQNQIHLMSAFTCITLRIFLLHAISSPLQYQKLSYILNFSQYSFHLVTLIEPWLFPEDTSLVTEVYHHLLPGLGVRSGKFQQSSSNLSFSVLNFLEFLLRSWQVH